MEVASSSPITSCNGGRKSPDLARIELFVFLTFLLSLLLFPVNGFRRRYNSRVLKVIALGVNAGIIILIPYIFGLMRNLSFEHELVSVWAVFLFYVYYNVPSIVRLDDPQSFGVTCVKIYVYIYCVAVILPNRYSQYSNALRCVLLVFLVSIQKGVETMGAFRVIKNADRAMGVPNSTPSNDDNKDDDVAHKSNHELKLSVGSPRSVPDDDALVDLIISEDSNDPWLTCNYNVYPVEKRCNYLNYGKTVTEREERESKPKITSVGEIWGCKEEGCILSSSMDLKNYCLSLSFYWMLRDRFSGIVSHRSSQQKEAWNLVRNGLLDRGPFGVIEDELAFLYEHLYNNSCIIFYMWPWTLGKHFLCLAGICSTAVLIHKKYHSKEEIIQYDKLGVDILLTWTVIIASTMVELVQIFICLSSRWSKMLLLRTYFIRGSWKKKNVWDRCIKKAAEIILCPAPGGGLFKPWQRQLGQYSLLDSCSYMRKPWSSIALFMLNVLTGDAYLRPGIKESKSECLTNEIKQAVIQKLLDRGRQLTNGIATLEASDEVPLETKRKLTRACTHVDTDAQVILIWHIATSLCEKKGNLPHSGGDDCKDVDVAKTLSKYCAYLVAFAPNMLPGNVATTNYFCRTVVEYAYTFIKKCKSSNIHAELIEITIKDDPGEAVNILQQGAILGKVLLTEIVDMRIRWKILAGFWAEMILYLAPNAHNEWAHAERLADGGEFITHLWALLFHAGIVDRHFFSKNAKDEEADP